MTMLSYDSDDADTISRELTEATRGVKTGMVTKSVRDARIDGISIHRNDFIAFTDQQMLASHPILCESVPRLLQALQIETHEFLIVIYGANTMPEAQTALRNLLNTKYPALEIHEIFDGPAAYEYTLILES